MPNINFPASPALNDVYTNNNRSWTWNGRYWRASSVTVGYTGSLGYTGSIGIGYTGSSSTQATIQVSGTQPVTSVDGTLWLDNETGDLGIYFNSGWTTIGAGVQGPSGFTGSTGAQGPAGGYTGSVGTRGYAGSQGPPNGYTGSAGAGYTGSIGGSGYTGSAGVGYTGSVGGSGYTGSIGVGYAGSVGVGYTGSAGRILPKVDTAASATTYTVNADIYDITEMVMTGAAGTLTISVPGGTPSNGQKLIYKIRCTYAQTLNWASIFQGSTDLSLPTLTSGNGKWDYYGFIYNSSPEKWQLAAKLAGF